LSFSHFRTTAQNGNRVAHNPAHRLKLLRLRSYPLLMPEIHSAPATASSFATVLSSLASPAPATETPWDDSALAEDVAVISYERALQAQTRMRSSGPLAPPPPQAPRINSGAPRSTIITLRLSHAESTQLHDRATEAGLTVSSYIRSCIFEAETLRTQVKEALGQLRFVASQGPNVTPPPAQPPSPTWRSRLVPSWLKV